MRNRLVAISFSLAALAACWSVIARGQEPNNVKSPKPEVNSGPVMVESQLSARATKAVFSKTEPVVFHVTLKNVTTKEVRYYDAHPKADFRIEGKNKSGKTVFHTEYVGSVWRNVLGRLPAGQKAQFKLKIHEFTDLKIGTYFIIVKRKVVEQRGRRHELVEIVSNPVQIKIVKGGAPKQESRS